MKNDDASIDGLNEKALYIMLSYTGTFASRLIKNVRKSKYAHSSIAFDENLNEMYSFARRVLYFPLIAGFIKEDIDDGVFKMLPKSECKVLKINVSEEEYEAARQKIFKFLAEYDKYKYGFINAVAINFNIKLKRKYKYVCSQFVAEMINDCTDVQLPKDPWLMTPADFEKIGEAVPIYEGLVNQYRSSRKLKIPKTA